MNFLRTIFIGLLVGLGLALSATAAGISLDGLLQNSPFIPRPDAGGGADRGSSRALEFRGVVTAGGTTLAGIVDHDTGEIFWVPVEVDSSATIATELADETLVVRGYDTELDQLRVRYQGRAFTLELAQAFLGVTPDGSASAVSEDITEALAATLAAAEAEPDDSDDWGNLGRRFVLASFGPAPRPAPHDEGNMGGFILFSPRAPITPEPAADTALFAPDTGPMIADSGAAVETSDDPWAGLGDEVIVLPNTEDGGRTRLIRLRVGKTQIFAHID